MEFNYDGGGLAKGGTVSLFVDGRKDGEGRIDMTIRWCSRVMKRAMSVRRTALPCRRITARAAIDLLNRIGKTLRRYSGVILPKTAGTITNRRSADSLSRLIEVESITGG